MMSGYDCLNKKRFSKRRKVDSELAATTSVGSVFQACGAATAKARLPGSARQNESLFRSNGTHVFVLLGFRSDGFSFYWAVARLPTGDSLTGGTARRLALVERGVRRPGKSSTRVSGPRYTNRSDAENSGGIRSVPLPVASTVLPVAARRIRPGLRRPARRRLLYRSNGR